MKTTIRWERNELTSDEAFVRDRRVRCLEKLGFMSTENVSEFRLASISAALRCSAKNQVDTAEQKYEVTGAAIPFVTFEKFYKRTLLSYTCTFMKNLIANSTLSPAKYCTNDEVQLKDISNNCEAVAILVIYSNVIKKAFNIKSDGVVSSGKKKRKKVLPQNASVLDEICEKKSKG